MTFCELFIQGEPSFTHHKGGNNPQRRAKIYERINNKWKNKTMSQISLLSSEVYKKPNPEYPATSKKKYIPNAKNKHGNILHKIQNPKLTEEITSIQYTHALSPFIYKGSRRSGEDSISTDFLVYDIDDISKKAFEDLLVKLNNSDYSYTLYSTQSSTDDAPKARLWFYLKDTVLTDPTNVDKYKKIYNNFAINFNIPADKACNDVARLFYPTKLEYVDEQYNNFFYSKDGEKVNIDEYDFEIINSHAENENKNVKTNGTLQNEIYKLQQELKIAPKSDAQIAKSYTNIIKAYNDGDNKWTYLLPFFIINNILHYTCKDAFSISAKLEGLKLANDVEEFDPTDKRNFELVNEVLAEKSKEIRACLEEIISSLKDKKLLKDKVNEKVVIPEKLHSINKYDPQDSFLPLAYHINNNFTCKFKAEIVEEKKGEVKENFLTISFFLKAESDFFISGVKINDETIKNHRESGVTQLNINYLHKTRIEKNQHGNLAVSKSIDSLNFNEEIKRLFKNNIGADISPYCMETILYGNFLYGFPMPIKDLFLQNIKSTNKINMDTEGKEYFKYSISSTYNVGDIYFLRDLARMSYLPTYHLNSNYSVALARDLIKAGYNCIKVNKNYIDKVPKIDINYKIVEDSSKVGSCWKVLEGEPSITINRLKTSEELIKNLTIKNTCEDNRYYNLFVKIIENITRDFEGNVNKKLTDFILAMVAKGLTSPYKNLELTERGCVVFEGCQGSGKSVFFKVLRSLYGDNMLSTTITDVIALNEGDFKTDFNKWLIAKYIIIDEMAYPNNIIRDNLKAFVYRDYQAINVKYKKPININLNYTSFVALNKVTNLDGFKQLLEEGSINRRYIIGNSTITLKEHIGDNMKTLKEMFDDNKLTEEAIANIITNIISKNNQDYNFVDYAEKDEDKQKMIESKETSPEGHLTTILEELSDHNVDFLYYGMTSNLKKEDVVFHGQDFNRIYTLNEYTGDTIAVPIGFFKKNYWNPKIPQYKKIDDFVKATKKTIEKNKLYSRLKVIFKGNLYFIVITINNKEEKNV